MTGTAHRKLSNFKIPQAPHRPATFRRRERPRLPEWTVKGQIADLLRGDEGVGSS
jgi:hypothetical protein